MPGPERRTISAEGRRKLARAEADLARAEGDLKAARARWAAVVREIGISAYARSIDATTSAVSEKVRYWESRAESG